MNTTPREDLLFTSGGDLSFSGGHVTRLAATRNDIAARSSCVPSSTACVVCLPARRD